MGRTRSQPGSKASPTDWGHSEDKRWVLGHLSSHRSAQVFICRKSHPPKVGPRLLRVAEGLCGAHSRLRPAPSSRRGRRGQDGCVPILRPCPAGLERWRRENGRCRAQGCRGRDDGFTGRVPAPFCSMGHPHQGGDGCICPCSFSGVSGHEKGRSVRSHALLECNGCEEPNAAAGWHSARELQVEGEGLNLDPQGQTFWGSHLAPEEEAPSGLMGMVRRQPFAWGEGIWDRRCRPADTPRAGRLV